MWALWESDVCKYWADSVGKFLVAIGAINLKIWCDSWGVKLLFLLQKLCRHLLDGRLKAIRIIFKSNVFHWAIMVVRQDFQQSKSEWVTHRETDENNLCWKIVLLQMERELGCSFTTAEKYPSVNKRCKQSCWIVPTKIKQMMTVNSKLLEPLQMGFF